MTPVEIGALAGLPGIVLGWLSASQRYRSKHSSQSSPNIVAELVRVEINTLRDEILAEMRNQSEQSRRELGSKLTAAQAQIEVTILKAMRHDS